MIIQGGPSCRRQPFVDFQLGVAFYYKKFILWRNFELDVNQQCSATRWATLYIRMSMRLNLIEFPLTQVLTGKAQTGNRGLPPGRGPVGEAGLGNLPQFGWGLGRVRYSIRSYRRYSPFLYRYLILDRFSGIFIKWKSILISKDTEDIAVLSCICILF